jgi:hypothetical protein
MNCAHTGCKEPAVENALCLGHYRHALTTGEERIEGRAVFTPSRQQEGVNVSERSPKRRCAALNAKGEPCRSTSVGSDGCCAAHSGKTQFGTPETARKGAQRSAEARRERVQKRERRVEEAQMSLTELLRVRAQERREELVKALLDAAAAGRDVPALRMVWERLDGKVADKLEVLSPEDESALERLREGRERLKAMTTEERLAFIRKGHNLRALPES